MMTADNFLGELEVMLVNKAAEPGQDKRRAAETKYARLFGMHAINAMRSGDRQVIGGAIAAAVETVGLLSLLMKDRTSLRAMFDYELERTEPIRLKIQAGR